MTRGNQTTRPIHPGVLYEASEFRRHRLSGPKCPTHHPATKRHIRQERSASVAKYLTRPRPEQPITYNMQKTVRNTNGFIGRVIMSTAATPVAHFAAHRTCPTVPGKSANTVSPVSQCCLAKVSLLGFNSGPLSFFLPVFDLRSHCLCTFRILFN